MECCYKKNGHSYFSPFLNSVLFNPIQSNVAFHIETCHSIFSANQMTGFYVKRNTGLKWVNILFSVFCRKPNVLANVHFSIFPAAVFWWCSSKYVFFVLCILESLFSKVVGFQLSACSFMKKRLRHRCFRVNYVKFSRTSFLQNWYERLNPYSVLIAAEF